MKNLGSWRHFPQADIQEQCQGIDYSARDLSLLVLIINLQCRKWGNVFFFPPERKADNINLCSIMRNAYEFQTLEREKSESEITVINERNIQSNMFHTKVCLEGGGTTREKKCDIHNIFQAIETLKFHKSRKLIFSLGKIGCYYYYYYFNYAYVF